MKSRRRKQPSKPLPFNGDHGTGTAAAIAGTVLEPVEGKNPNRIAVRRRKLQSEEWRGRLTMRQLQAAQAIENAAARVEALGSGGDSIARMADLRTIVDASPKPDAAIDMQTGARSHLIYVMRPIPETMRPAIQHLFWEQRALSELVKGKAFAKRVEHIKAALDLVANHLRY